MKITDVCAVRVEFPGRDNRTAGRSRSWWSDAEVANPMSRYPACEAAPKPLAAEVGRGLVPGDAGGWHLGAGADQNGRPVAAVIDDHLGPMLVGEEIMAGEKLADMLFRLTKPYGSTGLASYAVSAIDLALWDARGKALQQPVYALLGGLQKDRMFCYATGNDVEWYQELGFQAFKLACPYGPADGLEGLKKNEEFVAKARETIGPDAELMLDCWMAFDLEYTVRLADTLRPYRLKWIEECLIPEDIDGHLALRSRLPWQTLATGEHWYTHVPFRWASHRWRYPSAGHQLVRRRDGVPPDRRRRGCSRRFAVILHAGGNSVSVSTSASRRRAFPGVSSSSAPIRACHWSRAGAIPASPRPKTAGLRPTMHPASVWRSIRPGLSRTGVRIALPHDRWAGQTHRAGSICFAGKSSLLAAKP